MADAAYNAVVFLRAHHRGLSSEAFPEGSQPAYVIGRFPVFVCDDTWGPLKEISICGRKPAAFGTCHGVTADEGDSAPVQQRPEGFMGVGFDAAEIRDKSIRVDSGMQHLLTKVLEGPDGDCENNKFSVTNGQ